MSYCVNPVTVVVGEGNECYQAIWKEVVLRSSRADMDTLTEISHMSLLTHFLNFPYSVSHLFAVYSLVFLSALFRNGSLPASSKNLYKYIYKFWNSVLLSLKFRIQMLLLNYVACIVWFSVFHNSRRSWKH